MEFVGPYTEPPARLLERLRLNTNFALHIASWRLAADGPILRHTVDIQMRQGVSGPGIWHPCFTVKDVMR